MAEDLRGCRTDIKLATEILSDMQRTALLDWISNSVDPSRNYNQAIKAREDGTGQWFLESNDFVHWINNPGLMWIYGIRKFFRCSCV
jgi:hypothetical protein